MTRFEVSRSTAVQADPARIHALVDDFHQWRSWSPWEDVDPELRRTYSGPESGVGSRYAWTGNRKAGAGSMVITSSSPERIEVEISFLKPWKATNMVAFELSPGGSGTEVTWRMWGENKGLAAVATKLFNMDKLVGSDFEKGLDRLKAAAEAPA